VLYLIGKYGIKDGRWVGSANGKVCWLRAVNPTDDELGMISSAYGIGQDLLKSALDDYELPRLEIDGACRFIYINTSRQSEDATWKMVKLGIAESNGVTITISNHETELVNDFAEAKIRDFGNGCGLGVMLQLLLRATQLFIRDLHLIDRRTGELEKKLGPAVKNSLIFEFHGLQKSLVYLRTAVNGNQLVLEKLRSLPAIIEDEKLSSLLDEIIVENKQACDMAAIHSEIMSNSVDAIASIINNNLNIVMKFLTSVTVVLSVPMIVSGLFGMNFIIPFGTSPFGFLMAVGLSALLTIVAIIIMRGRSLF